MGGRPYRTSYLNHPALARAFMIIASQSWRDTLKSSRIPVCLMVVPSLNSLQPSRSSVWQSARSSMDLISISQRPAAVEDRAMRGHWESDLLSGSKNSYIATLVERHTRYVLLVKIPGQSEQQGEAAMRGAWRLLGMTRAGSRMCMTSSLKLLRRVSYTHLRAHE